MHVVNIAGKLARISETWSPRIVGELNGQHVKVAKLQGSFVWHRHEREDELFLVVRGVLRLRFRDPDREIAVHEGEFVIVPRGVDHLPVAEEECHVLLFEPAGTLNTGNVGGDRTIEAPERI